MEVSEEAPDESREWGLGAPAWSVRFRAALAPFRRPPDPKMRCKSLTSFSLLGVRAPEGRGSSMVGSLGGGRVSGTRDKDKGRWRGTFWFGGNGTSSDRCGSAGAETVRAGQCWAIRGLLKVHRSKESEDRMLESLYVLAGLVWLPMLLASSLLTLGWRSFAGGEIGIK